MEERLDELGAKLYLCILWSNFAILNDRLKNFRVRVLELSKNVDRVKMFWYWRYFVVFAAGITVEIITRIYRGVHLFHKIYEMIIS